MTLKIEIFKFWVLYLKPPNYSNSFSFHYFFHKIWPPRVAIPKGLGDNHKNNVQENSLIIMLLDLNHFGVTHNLRWKLQLLHILHMNIANANWQIFLSPILLVIGKWIPNVRLCFDITSFHIGWFKWCNEKASKIIYIQQGSS